MGYTMSMIDTLKENGKGRGAWMRRHIIATGDYVKKHAALRRVSFSQKSKDGFL